MPAPPALFLPKQLQRELRLLAAGVSSNNIRKNHKRRGTVGITNADQVTDVVGGKSLGGTSYGGTDCVNSVGWCAS